MTDRVIYKYPLHEVAQQFGEVIVPEGDVVLVAEFENRLTAWIQHKKNTIHKMYLEIVPTGKEFDDNKTRHVGSARVGPFVWHVYRRY